MGGSQNERFGLRSAMVLLPADQNAAEATSLAPLAAGAQGSRAYTRLIVSRCSQGLLEPFRSSAWRVPELTAASAAGVTSFRGLSKRKRSRWFGLMRRVRPRLQNFSMWIARLFPGWWKRFGRKTYWKRRVQRALLLLALGLIGYTIDCCSSSSPCTRQRESI